MTKRKHDVQLARAHLAFGWTLNILLVAWLFFYGFRPRSPVLLAVTIAIVVISVQLGLAIREYTRMKNEENRTH